MKLGEIVLWGEERAGELEVWPAIVHAINEDGTVNLTPFTDYEGGVGPVKGVPRAEDDKPAAFCWWPAP